jgi:hypothetical protein
VARSAAAAHSGTYSLAQTVSSSSGGWDLDNDPSWDALIAAGGTYTATMWVRASSTVKVVLYVDLLTRSGAYSDSAESPLVTLKPNTWTKLTATFTAASNQALGAMSANFSRATSGTVILYDDMSLVAK